MFTCSISAYLKANLCPSDALESPYSAPEETLYQSADHPAERGRRRGRKTKSRRYKKKQNRAGRRKTEVRGFHLRVIQSEITFYRQKPHYLLGNSKNLICLKEQWILLCTIIQQIMQQVTKLKEIFRNIILTHIKKKEPTWERLPSTNRTSFLI